MAGHVFYYPRASRNIPSHVFYYHRAIKFVVEHVFCSSGLCSIQAGNHKGCPYRTQNPQASPLQNTGATANSSVIAVQARSAQTAVSISVFGCHTEMGPAVKHRGDTLRHTGASAKRADSGIHLGFQCFTQMDPAVSANAFAPG
jgi:hypothetical protein